VDATLEILRRAVIAAFRPPNGVTDSPRASQALADLSVTGRITYSMFISNPPQDEALFNLVEAEIRGFHAGARSNPELIRTEIRRILNRAYTVAWALRGSPSQRSALRAGLGWIALSSEDDSPHAPTNNNSTAHHMGELFIQVGRLRQNITLRGTLILPTNPGNDTLPNLTNRSVPSTTIFSEALMNRSAFGYDTLFLFVHGLGSICEESDTFKQNLIRLGATNGKRYAVLSIDMPGMGYSERLDIDRLVANRVRGYHGFALPNGSGSNFPLLSLYRDTLVELCNTISGGVQHVMGGSLGGNMTLWLASEPMFSDIEPSRSEPSSIISYLGWSPASIWESYERSRDTPLEGNGTHMDIGKNAAKKRPQERMQQRENERSRWEFFNLMQRGETGGTILSIISNGGWSYPPSKGQLLLQSELYGEQYRRTFWTAAYEQVTFSHQEPLTPSGRWPFQTINKPLFLASGSKDTGSSGVTDIYNPVVNVSNICNNVIGRRYLIANTGHSISDEEPELLARLISDFLSTSSYLGSFSAVYAGGGIGGFDIRSSNDKLFAFDYNSNGRADHLVIYRPGTGTVWILRNNSGTFTPVYRQGDPGSGIGGFDLRNGNDKMFAFDYNGNGRLDHLVIYRPGTGTVWILRNDSGTFTPVYRQGDPGSGIGGFDLRNGNDKMFAFDYNGNGRLDHLVIYRPGTGTVWILRNNSGTFTPVYRQGDPGSGIGGFDLRNGNDKMFAFDYNGNGRLNHLVIYRPGTGTVWILRNNGGTFTPVYRQGDPGSGIGGFDLRNNNDTMLAFDYNNSGRADHLILSRPGEGALWILRRNVFFRFIAYRHLVGNRLSRTGDATILDHPLLNDRPNAMIFVNSVWGYEGQGLDNSQLFGVIYSEGRWQIVNLSGGTNTMNPAFSFNVLIAPSDFQNAFIHTANRNTLYMNRTYIDHPLTNGNPDAHLLVTSNYTYAQRNNREIVLSYEAAVSKWFISNSVPSGTQAYDQVNYGIIEGSKFNILVLNGDNLSNLEVFHHQANPNNILHAATFLDHRLLNRNPNAMMFTNMLWTSTSGGSHNPSAFALWYDSPIDAYRNYRDYSWFIYNNWSGVPMAQGTSFKVFVLND
jgi:pimeloyl-ACP methyl ester carboxylesterase